MKSRYWYAATFVTVLFIQFLPPVAAQETIEGQKIIIDRERFIKISPEEEQQKPVNTLKVENMLGWETIITEDF